MADIAMLVAEEYERRVKITKAAGGSESQLPMEMIFERLKQKVGEEKRYLENHLRNWVFWEPRTQIADAASNSFFSA